MILMRAKCELNNREGFALPGGSRALRLNVGDEFLVDEANAVRHERKNQAARVEAPKPAKAKKASKREG